jgi:hypothetical protein
MGDGDGLRKMFQELEREGQRVKSRYIHREYRGSESTDFQEPPYAAGDGISERAKAIKQSPVNC